MLKHTVVKVVLLMGLLSSVTKAMEDINPVVTTNTILGVWEAISDRSYRVFQLEISAQDGVLTYGTCHLKKPGVYHLTKRHVAEDGLLKLEFANEKKERILIYGSGLATKDEGILEVQLDMNPGDSPNIWKLDFIRIDGDLTYVEMLGELSRKASAGRSAANKSCPPRGAEGGSGSESTHP